MTIILLMTSAAAMLMPGGIPTQTRAEEAATLLAMLIVEPPHVPRKARADALDKLDRIGLRPSTPSESEMVATWRREARLRPVAWRGRMLGPAFRQGLLAAGQHVEFAQVFSGGQRATVAMRSVPGDPISMRITSSTGASVCIEQARCTWLPRFTERATVRLENTTVSPGRFVVVVD